MLIPVIVGIVYREDATYAFLVTIVLCTLCGVLMTIKKPRNTVFYLKEGCVTTALCWILMSIFGCLPFFISGEIPSFTDALFETVSGFTTTGASILNDVECLSQSIMFWRCFTHWIGGMGVLVFLLAIIPLTGGSNINLMKAESPGPSVRKLVPKMRYTARILYIIYFGMTVMQIILLLFGGMSFLDAVNTAMATAGTGDVLTGMTGAFLAQGWRPFEAALGAVWLHGKAADSIAENLKGFTGILAGELAPAAREILNSLIAR